MCLQPALDSLVRAYRFFYGQRTDPVFQADRGCGYAVLDIDPARDPAPDAFDHPVRMDKVEYVMPEFVRMRVAGMEVGLWIVI